jgi:hypothetical protein
MRVQVTYESGLLEVTALFNVDDTAEDAPLLLDVVSWLVEGVKMPSGALSKALHDELVNLALDEIYEATGHQFL